MPNADKADDVGVGALETPHDATRAHGLHQRRLGLTLTSDLDMRSPKLVSMSSSSEVDNCPSPFSSMRRNALTL